LRKNQKRFNVEEIGYEKEFARGGFDPLAPDIRDEGNFLSALPAEKTELVY
jgi:hypothetical protein